MNLLVWNCRGLGNLRTERELVSILRAKDPSVVFIAETWADEARLERTLSNINFDQKWVVPRTTRGGGLVLFWKNSVNLTVVESHKYYIDAIINKNGDNEWRFTGFYGEPDSSRRNEAWAKLRSLNSSQNIPWLCAGDFNEITRQEEKIGGAFRSFNQMQRFRDVIDECGLMDLGFVGPSYTWSKHFDSGQSIWERLDRGLATNDWFLKFPGTKIHHLHCYSSDHLPLFINLSGLELPVKRKVFRFEEMWLSDDRCGETVEAAWSSTESPDPSCAILKKIAKCEKDLTWWNSNCFGNVRRTLVEKNKLLAAAELVAMRTGDNSHVRLLKAEINVLIDREARMWSQRSRVLWLSKGDSNSKFFHSKATKRLRKNSILGIRDPCGRWLNQTEDIGQAFINYYTELFSSSNSISQGGALEKIPKVVTDGMNADLGGTFHEWEILDAIKQMAPLKAPGPDGMPPLFYQHFWPVVDKDVTSSVLMWLNSGILPSPINHTFITLIPKVDSPELVTEFRPISLCNVLYKIFSKVLANRLKKFLPNLITEHQSAFAKNRLITDNILVAFETLHCMKNQTSSKSGSMALKLDMSKAYDRVEWNYLESLMLKMGFSTNWTALIMACVKSVTYSLLINGEPKGLITPTRGIRQGDPLSPFLFLLCTEGLHGLIEDAARVGDLRGFSLCNRGPKLTHLFFADDSLLFCRANLVECSNILKLLGVYEQSSGQKINKDKTALFFSKSTPQATKDSIKGLLGVQEIMFYEKYLGLPSLVGRGKKASFNYIKERVWRKLQGWEGKLLSQAGREVLIKAVIQAIPSFAMGCFKLPLGLCHEIEAMVKKFWWGQRGDRKIGRAHV